MALPTPEEFRAAMQVYVGRLRGHLNIEPFFGRQPTPAEGLKALEVVIPVAEACRDNKQVANEYTAAAVNSEGYGLCDNCLCYVDLRTPPAGPIPWVQFLERANIKRRDWADYVERGIQ